MNQLVTFASYSKSVAVAVAKKANHTAYDVQYSCRNLTVWLHLYGNAKLTLTFFYSTC